MPEGDGPGPLLRTWHSDSSVCGKGAQNQPLLTPCLAWAATHATARPSSSASPAPSQAVVPTGRPQRSPLPAPQPSTHHINELCDGQAKVDQDHVRDVGHGPGPLVVAREESLQQPFLCMGPGLRVAAHCWDRQGGSSGAGHRAIQAAPSSHWPCPAALLPLSLLAHPSHHRTFARAPCSRPWFLL